MPLAEALRDCLGLTGAVETGTFRGASARALAQRFAHVHTIELSRHLYEVAKSEVPANVTAHHGSSADLMPSVIDKVSGPQLFWLDGHWSGGITAGVSSECPVLDEVRAIDESEWGAGSAVLVDDARLFLAPPPPPHKREQWPAFIELADKLRAVHPRYVTIVEDVIVAVPVLARALVEDYAMTVADVQQPGRRRFSDLVAKLRQ